MVTLIVITGALVRLTGSGLGCPDWPSCSHTQFTAQLSFHPLVEFGNRLVTVAVTIAVGLTMVASFLRQPRRKDLIWLSAGLVGGVLAQAVLGGIVVYTKLNPYLVMVHFLTTVLLLGVAVVLLHRAGRDYSPGSGRLLVPRPMLLLGRGLVALLAVVLIAGSATTGAAPDAGGATGQLVAKRIPVALRDLAELHSTLALFLVGVALATAVALHALDVPERLRKAGRILVVVLVAQAAVGYIQYFTHLPAVLVEVHEVGATALVIGTLQVFLALTHRRPEATLAPSTGPEAGTEPAIPAGTAARGRLVTTTTSSMADGGRGGEGTGASGW